MSFKPYYSLFISRTPENKQEKMSSYQRSLVLSELFSFSFHAGNVLQQHKTTPQKNL